MWASLTLDGTLEETHYLAHLSGCLVRWSEIRELPDDNARCYIPLIDHPLSGTPDKGLDANKG